MKYHGISRPAVVARAAAIALVALAGLPEDYREAVRLRYLEQKSLEEVTAAMRRSPGAIRGLLDRAKRKLREAMGRSSLYFSRM